MKLSERKRGQRCLLPFLLLPLILSLLCLPGAPSEALEANYGVSAWEYLKIIDASYPNRVSDVALSPDSSLKDNCGEWISSELKSMGYEPEIISWNHEGTQVVSYVARKQGKSNKTLTIGAHYDSVATKGVEDNGTGVALTLELARRFKDADTYLSLDFCFWDCEETQGFAGSYSYVCWYRELSDIVCYLNLDCIGAGDRMYAYGGEYNESGELINDGPLWLALKIAEEKGIDLYTMPECIEKFPTPTRTGSSDQYYFAFYHIPYVYFEANAWVTSSGEPGRTDRPHYYNSDLPCFADTNGQIIHLTEYEDLATLETLVPGRIKAHLTSYSQISTEWILRMDASSLPEEKTTEASSTDVTSSSETESSGETKTSETGTSVGSTEKTEAGSDRTTPASSDSGTEHLPDGRDKHTDATGHEDQDLTRETEQNSSAAGVSTETDPSPGEEENHDDSRSFPWIPVVAVVLDGAVLVGAGAVIYRRRIARMKRK